MPHGSPGLDDPTHCQGETEDGPGHQGAAPDPGQRIHTAGRTTPARAFYLSPGQTTPGRNGHLGKATATGLLDSEISEALKEPPALDPRKTKSPWKESRSLVIITGVQ